MTAFSFSQDMSYEPVWGHDWAQLNVLWYDVNSCHLMYWIPAETQKTGLHHLTKHSWNMHTDHWGVSIGNTFINAYVAMYSALPLL